MKIPSLTSNDAPLILPNGQEVKTHGTTNIPYAVYRGNIPSYIPSYPLHYHEEMEVIYCVCGSGRITIDGIQHMITPKDFVVILPEQIHAIEALIEPFEYFNILFKFSMIEAEREDNAIYQQYLSPFATGLVCVPTMIKKESSLSKKLSPHILPLIESRHSDDLLMIKSHLYAIMDSLYHVAEPSTFKSHAVHKANIFLRLAIQFIDDHYAEKIQISQVSRFCGYSDSHFMKLFKDLTGSSFSQYLVHFRLEKAAGLLRSTDRSIIEIATLCGFSNASYFTRAFIKQFKCTPSTYRLS